MTPFAPSVADSHEPRQAMARARSGLIKGIPGCGEASSILWRLRRPRTCFGEAGTGLNA